VLRLKALRKKVEDIPRPEIDSINAIQKIALFFSKFGSIYRKRGLGFTYERTNRCLRVCLTCPLEFTSRGCSNRSFSLEYEFLAMLMILLRRTTRYSANLKYTCVWVTRLKTNDEPNTSIAG